MSERWRLKKGDRVEVISGADKGRQGEILKVFREDRRILVAGVNVVTKHVKPSQRDAGGIVREERSIHASNVMLIDADLNKPTRVGVKVVDGRKVRFSKRSGSTID